MKVSVVDDNLVLRGFLAEVISRNSDLEITKGYGTLREIQSALRSPATVPDYIILDIVLPDGKGWEVLKETPIVRGRTKVFFATGRIDQNTLLYFAQRQIDGFIDKTTARFEDWAEAFECIAQNQRYCSASLVPDVSNLMMNSNHWSKLLTEKELDVLPHLATGRVNAELAQRLGVSPATIQVHRKHIMRKIGVHSSTELMRWARRVGLSFD